MQKKTTCLSPGSFGRADQFHQRKWRQVQFLADLFWKRCLWEYLPSLQNREKWHGALPNLKQNALVSLANENTSRGRRNLGRIGQKLRHLESNYKEGPPSATWCWTFNPRCPMGGRMFGNEHCFGKHISGFKFSLSFVFPPIFTWNFLAYLSVVKTLSIRLWFYFVAQKFLLSRLITPCRLFNIKGK